ncbi:hypothetical protein AC1031_010787 [Aphanomyces cochlioides]|nr:hypothetical protein AC1031_010787 [Aphanomyces cochlioides]
MAVAPLNDPELLREHSTRRQKLLLLLGLGYVALTIGCSWWFCLSLAQSTSNDAFWFKFNHTVQAWLMGAFNQLNHDYPVDISSLMYAQPHIDVTGVITLHQTQSRLLFYSQILVSPVYGYIELPKSKPNHCVSDQLILLDRFQPNMGTSSHVHASGKMLRPLSKQWCGIFGSPPPEYKHDNIRVVLRRFRWTVYDIHRTDTAPN